jgi:hypothetical protein
MTCYEFIPIETVGTVPVGLEVGEISIKTTVSDFNSLLPMWSGSFTFYEMIRTKNFRCDILSFALKTPYIYTILALLRSTEIIVGEERVK